jgi:hypothetical protein
MKYRDRFHQLEELGNPTMGRFMLSEVLTKMAGTCKQCQRDRMRCTLRPLCLDRVFLNILIALGARTADLPSFCYQVHLRTLQSYLKSGANRDHPQEPRYPLRYFRRFIQFKKDDPNANYLAFKEYLEKATKQTVHGYALNNTWYFGVGTGIFVVDVRRGLVSLDPDGDIVKREALEPLLTFLTEMLHLQVEILKDLEDTWYLRMELPKFSEPKFSEDVQPKLEELKELWSFVRANDINRKTRFLVSLDPIPDLSIRLQGLRKTVKILAEITKVAPKSRKQAKTTEKTTTKIAESAANPPG